MQVTLMVVNCHRVQDISANLHLSLKTVNSYRYRIFGKLNVSSDVELALLAVRRGMIATNASAVPIALAPLPPQPPLPAPVVLPAPAAVALSEA